MQPTDVARRSVIGRLDEITVEVEDVALVGKHRARRLEPRGDARRLLGRLLHQQLLCMASEEAPVLGDLPAIGGHQHDGHRANLLYRVLRPRSRRLMPRCDTPRAWHFDPYSDASHS